MSGVIGHCSCVTTSPPGATRTQPPHHASTSASASIARCQASRASGKIVSSASRNSNHAPAAAAIPSFRAAETPRDDACRSRMRGSAPAYRRTIPGVSSADPSSTTMASQSVKVCSCSAAMVAGRVAAAFKAPITTEKNGTATRYRRMLAMWPLYRARVPIRKTFGGLAGLGVPCHLD